MINILFITHDFTQTGAPIALLTLIRHLKNTGKYSIYLSAISEHGILKNEFIVNVDEYIKINEFYKRQYFFNNRKNKFDIVFLNTIVSGDIVNIFSEFKSKKIIWIHEMPFFLEKLYRKQFDNIIKSKFEIIVVNHYQYNYINNIDNTSELKIIQPIYNENYIQNANTIDCNKPINVRLIGSSIWTKGIYLLPELLQKLSQFDIGINWYGHNSNIEFEQLMYELNTLNIKNLNLMHSYSSIDELTNRNVVNLSLSHLDSYPLTIIESALNKIPSICWDKGNGFASIAPDEVCFKVPYRNFDSMVNLIVMLQNDKSQIEERGQKAHEYIIRNNIITIAKIKDCLS